MYVPGLSVTVTVFVPPMKVGRRADHRAPLGDRHVVFELRRVRHRDRDLPGLRAQRLGVVGERVVRVGARASARSAAAGAGAAGAGAVVDGDEEAAGAAGAGVCGVAEDRAGRARGRLGGAAGGDHGCTGRCDHQKDGDRDHAALARTCPWGSPPSAAEHRARRSAPTRSAARPRCRTGRGSSRQPGPAPAVRRVCASGASLAYEVPGVLRGGPAVRAGGASVAVRLSLLGVGGCGRRDGLGLGLRRARDLGLGGGRLEAGLRA